MPEFEPTLGSTIQANTSSPPSCESGCGGCGGCGTKVSKDSIFTISLDLNIIPDSLDADTKQFLEDNKQVLDAIPDGVHADLKIGDRIFTGNKTDNHIEGFMSKTYDESVVNIDASSFIKDKSIASTVTNKLPNQPPVAPLIPDHIKRLQEKRTQNIASEATSTAEKAEEVQKKPSVQDKKIDVQIPTVTTHRKVEVDTYLSKDTNASKPFTSEVIKDSPKLMSQEKLVDEKETHYTHETKPTKRAPKIVEKHTYETEIDDARTTEIKLPEPNVTSKIDHAISHELKTNNEPQPINIKEFIQTHNEARKALFTFITIISEIDRNESPHDIIVSPHMDHAHDAQPTQIYIENNEIHITTESRSDNEIVILTVPDQSMNVIRQFLIAALATPSDISGVFHIDEDLGGKEHNTQTFILEDHGKFWQIQLVSEHNKPLKIIASRQALKILKKRLEKHVKKIHVDEKNEMFTAEEENQGNLVSLSLGYTDDTLLFWFSYLQLKALLPTGAIATRSSLDPKEVLFSYGRRSLPEQLQCT
jgi:hypothetical protein